MQYTSLRSTRCNTQKSWSTQCNTRKSWEHSVQCKIVSGALSAICASFDIGATRMCPRTPAAVRTTWRREQKHANEEVYAKNVKHQSDSTCLPTRTFQQRHARASALLIFVAGTAEHQAPPRHLALARCAPQFNTRTSGILWSPRGLRHVHGLCSGRCPVLPLAGSVDPSTLSREHPITQAQVHAHTPKPNNHS